MLLGTAVQEVAEDHLVLAGGARAGRLGCGLVVWAAGVGPGDLAARLEVAKARGGRLAVEPNLALPGHKEAFAVGDIAGAPAGPDEGAGVLPQLAQPAIQGGRHAAREIVRQLAGLGPLEFRYHDKGILATIGRRSAVAEIPLPRPFTGRSLRLRGTLAWLAWLVLHVVVLLGRRNRAAVLLNWAWRYVAWRRGPRVIVGG